MNNLSIEVDSPVTEPNYYCKGYGAPPQFHSSALHCSTVYISKTIEPEAILHTMENDFVNELRRYGMTVESRASVLGTKWNFTLVCCTADASDYVVNCLISVMDDGATNVQYRKLSGSSTLHSLLFKKLVRVLDNISDPESDSAHDNTPPAPIPLTRRLSLEIDPMATPLTSTWSPPPPPSTAGPSYFGSVSDDVSAEPAVSDEPDALVPDEPDVSAEPAVSAEHASLVPAVSVPDAFDEDIAATSAKMCDDMNKVFEELLNLREESLETREYILDNSLAEFNGCVCSYNKHLSFQRFGDISATIILCSIVFAFWY